MTTPSRIRASSTSSTATAISSSCCRPVPLRRSLRRSCARPSTTRDDIKMKLRRPFMPPLLAIVRGIISTVLLVALLLRAWSIGPAPAADAGVDAGQLALFRLADPTHPNTLHTGHLLFPPRTPPEVIAEGLRAALDDQV